MLASEGDRVAGFTVRAINTESVELTGPEGAYVLTPSPHEGVRARWSYVAPAAPLVDPDRREAETENDQ